MQARIWPAAAAAASIFIGVAAAAETAKPGTTAAPETISAAPEGPHLLAEVESGRVIAHFDAQRPWHPASTTKLMTVYVAFRAVADGQLSLSSPVIFSEYAAAQPSSRMGFGAGTVITLDNALKMMMVKSANDVAIAVAETVGGSEAAFAERMNEHARRLGMTRSVFVNPHGLPDSRQVTSARDMAVLTRALLTQFPQYREYFSLHAIQLGNQVFENFNPLIARYPGATGMKTGFICASGYNLVATARRGNRELLAIVFGAYGGTERAERAAALLDDGFRSAGPPGVPPVTLAGVFSGRAYSEPLDMRPYVCAPAQEATASEANTDNNASGSEEEQVSHLGLPMYLGPPVQVFVEISGEGVGPGDIGFVARLPRIRPTLDSDDPHASLDAFVPTGGADGAAAEPARAIGSTVGAPSPLSGVTPD
jgi:D-alanyl-D-alanine carboxypeptidase